MQQPDETVTVTAADLELLRKVCALYAPFPPTDEISGVMERTLAALDGAAPAEPGSAAPGEGQWMRIAFMGHIEYTGYVTEITKNGQPAYRVDLPEKIWGGNPLAYVEHAASAWFSDRPVTEESVRKAWEAQLLRAAERRRQEAEWQRMQEQRAITAGDGDGDLNDPDYAY
jgi:hypothetical protein